MVLLIVALATSLAAFMATQQNLWLRQVESQFERAQARRIGIAAIDWARAVLADDARASSIDHEKEIWAMRLPAQPVENGEVTGVIEDRQGLFNLNNLVRNGATSAPDVAQFQKLLGMLGLPVELATTLADWMDADSEAQYPGGAEDAYYLALPRPYRAANRPLAEIGELSLVKGFDSRTIERLRPFVAVLPVLGAINVNFAPPEVLAAVVGNMNLADARLMVQQRSVRPFKDVADFRQRLPHGGIQVSDLNITISSQFFLVTGRGSVGRAQVTAQALLQRTGGWPTVVWQSVQ
ncbi:type II secretion system protein K [Ferrigenium kumadai]|uniref:Type II secretion system protein K n=2 Tax=Ferrigenium kumadai TaxID=1682490 RepID=A0AAN1W0G9_9PROT|nr:type II secretion system protein K [Ferrigenium kumadai]